MLNMCPVLVYPTKKEYKYGETKKRLWCQFLW
jgi:hypothetical protein